MLSSSLLVLAAVSSTGSTPAPLPLDWSSLDREIEALSAALAVAESGPKIDGFLRTRFAHSGDVDASAAAGNQDLGGFNLDNARLRLTGDAADGYSYTVSMEGGDSAVSDASGTGFALLDAYAGVSVGDWGSLSIGRFSSTILWNAGVSEDRLLFLDKSFLDEAWDGRDIGVELFVHQGSWCGWVAAQNGADSQGDDLALSARASCHLIGDALYGGEGSEGLAEGEQHLTVGVGWFDDQSLDDGSAIAGDVVFARDRWSAVAEIVDFGDDIRPAPVVNAATGIEIPGAAATTGAQTPWGVTVGYLVQPNVWEVGARWQEFDDDSDTSGIGAVVNRYFAGHDAKWTLELDTYDSDVAALEVTTVALGLTVGF